MKIAFLAEKTTRRQVNATSSKNFAVLGVNSGFSALALMGAHFVKGLL